MENVDTHAVPGIGARLQVLDGNYGGAEQIRQLINRAYELRGEPLIMDRFASVALSWARMLEPADKELEAAAWTCRANAHRVLSRFEEAEYAFAEAFDLFKLLKESDSLLEAEACEQLASLRQAQRRFGESFELLSRARRSHQRAGRRHAVARTLVSEGTTRLYSGDSKGAVYALTEAVQMSEVCDQLALSAVHNLCWALVDFGQPDTALRCFRSVSHFYPDNNPFSQARRTWLEGHIMAAFGLTHAAEAALLAAVERFSELSLAYELALASLELAIILARDGRWIDMTEAARRALSAFGQLGIDPERSMMSQLLRAAETRPSEAARYLGLCLKRLSRMRRP